MEEDIKIIGKSINEVNRMNPDIDYRIAMEDGEIRFLTCDFDEQRYNFNIENGIIVSFTKG